MSEADAGPSRMHQVQPAALPRVWLPFCGTVGLACVLFLIGLRLGTQNGRDYFDAAYKAASLLILSSGLLSVLLARRQHAEAKAKQIADLEFNRVETFYRYFSADASRATNDRFAEVAHESKIDAHFNAGGEAITADLVNQIVDNTKWSDAARAYLDCLESLAAAVHSGFVDEEYAFCLQAGRVLRAVKVLGPLISHFQIANAKAYIELVDLASTWQERRDKEIAQELEAKKPKGQVQKDKFGNRLRR